MFFGKKSWPSNPGSALKVHRNPQIWRIIPGFLSLDHGPLCTTHEWPFEKGNNPILRGVRFHVSFFKGTECEIENIK